MAGPRRALPMRDGHALTPHGHTDAATHHPDLARMLRGPFPLRPSAQVDRSGRQPQKQIQEPLHAATATRTPAATLASGHPNELLDRRLPIEFNILNPVVRDLPIALTQHIHTHNVDDEGKSRRREGNGQREFGRRNLERQVERHPHLSVGTILHRVLYHLAPLHRGRHRWHVALDFKSTLLQHAFGRLREPAEQDRVRAAPERDWLVQLPDQSDAVAEARRRDRRCECVR
mmetsp:Transcript_70192/g.196471  ORF Transcript_70192/g.196471 Transcript_70192/m.196471 type:complete len:231 (-) Transcript_70192:539-1231(-)